MCAGLTALGHVGRGAVHSLPFLPAQLTIARLSPYTACTGPAHSCRHVAIWCFYGLAPWHSEGATARFD